MIYRDLQRSYTARPLRLTQLFEIFTSSNTINVDITMQSLLGNAVQRIQDRANAVEPWLVGNLVVKIVFIFYNTELPLAQINTLLNVFRKAVRRTSSSLPRAERQHSSSCCYFCRFLS
ncbi:d2.4 [Tranosema rostrale ichnovirus]|nr:d2.4 [Tranosema rostrale ichnovirus]